MVTYTTEFVALNWRTVFLLATTEPTLIDELGKLLLHHLLDLCDGFLETLFGLAGDVEIQGRVLVCLGQ